MFVLLTCYLILVGLLAVVFWCFGFDLRVSGLKALCFFLGLLLVFWDLRLPHLCLFCLLGLSFGFDFWVFDFVFASSDFLLL